MAPKKGSQEWKGTTKSYLYGVDRNTLEVVSLVLTNGGTLTRWQNGSPGRSVSVAGREAKAEATIVFNLLDVEEVPALFDSPDVRARVEERAEARRKERDAASDPSKLNRESPAGE